MHITDTALYLTDNGAVLCGQHLGSTARHTGRDLVREAMDCKRCNDPLDGSTATVIGTEGYPPSVLRAGDALCRNCERDRAEAFPGEREG